MIWLEAAWNLKLAAMARHQASASAFIVATIRMKAAAASILDYTDEITRETLPSLGPALEPAASNVVKLTKRQHLGESAGAFGRGQFFQEPSSPTQASAAVLANDPRRRQDSPVGAECGATA